MTPEERRAYNRRYYATHPEQRAKRDARTRKWISEHRREWNIYQSNYSYRKRNGCDKETEEET